ncbi:MAG: hypothetical protein DRO93_14990 [Candidatus Thorarchaeota archaeon]|nr:MAG: hypothetical protein DRO93_14990 [Candidatus Thorarchaeota archaeon]
MVAILFHGREERVHVDMHDPTMHSGQPTWTSVSQTVLSCAVSASVRCDVCGPERWAVVFIVQACGD